MTSIETFLKKKFQELPKTIAPGFHLQVYQAGKKKADMTWQKTWPLYDLASLTKILFTTMTMAQSVQDKKIRLSQSVTHFCPWWPHDQSIKSLLNHTANNIWWAPFYKKIDRQLSVELRRNQLRQELRQLGLKKTNHAVYSDIDFLLLGFVLENAMESSLLFLWNDLKTQCYGDENIFFRPENNGPKRKTLFAPTEKCPWRKKTLQGEVHDDNAWSFGGVSTHAGLFGSAKAVSRCALVWRDILLGRHKYFETKYLKAFTKRSVPMAKGDWGLGFMLPTKGSSSAGSYFSSASFGHIGFTGTSLWIDPKEDIIVTLLSNRVHPSRNHKEFNQWRPKIHDWVVEALNE